MADSGRVGRIGAAYRIRCLLQENAISSWIEALGPRQSIWKRWTCNPLVSLVKTARAICSSVGVPDVLTLHEMKMTSPAMSRVIADALDRLGYPHRIQRAGDGARVFHH